MSSEHDRPRKSAPAFSLSARVASFGHAFAGIASLIRSEHNSRIHAVATCVVLSAGIGFGIDRTEWFAVVLAIACVWAAESFNTAIETLCDVVSPDLDPRIKKVKDVSAGGVLATSIGALTVGLLVFVPRLIFLVGWND